MNKGKLTADKRFEKALARNDFVVMSELVSNNVGLALRVIDDRELASRRNPLPDGQTLGHSAVRSLYVAHHALIGGDKKTLSLRDGAERTVGEAAKDTIDREIDKAFVNNTVMLMQGSRRVTKALRSN